MSWIPFAIFFTLAFTIYGSLNLYVFFHSWIVVSRYANLKWIYTVFYIFMAVSFIVGRLGERWEGFTPSSFLVHLGSIWLAFLVYFFLSALVIDLLRLFFNWTGLVTHLPGFINPRNILLFVLTIVSGTVIAGYINALNPVTVRHTLPILRPESERDSFRVVLASDIHLGTIIANSRVGRLVQMINQEKPDLILLAGDQIDEDLGPVIRLNLGESLKKLQSRLGIYAVNGNHEFIGGVDRADRYLEEHGIQVLRDSWVQVEDFIIAGREDYSMVRFTGTPRKDLAELLRDIPGNLPVILLDHQPHHLEEAVANGIALQLSGHTHRGQLWPFHTITNRIFEVDYGLKKIRDTFVYVSCGYGTWGPPVRTGNRPEVVVFDLVKK